MHITVFATARGWWVVAGDAWTEFDDRAGAVAHALRLAGVARWRGEATSAMAQDRLGGELTALALGPAAHDASARRAWSPASAAVS